MTRDQFRTTLQAAVAGDHSALETIMEMYMPLINRYSRYAGELDEDCRQYILIHIAQNIYKFTL